MTTDQALVSALERKRDELHHEMAQLTQPIDESGGISFGKRVGDATSIAVERITQVAAHDGLQQALADVERALAKVADGTYGQCDSCGKPIPAERLEARPWALLCVACASH